MILWLVFALLAAVAILFVVWRVLFPVSPARAPDNDLAANRNLYREKLDQLRAQLAAGDIDQTAFYSLELEYQRQFLADNQQLDITAQRQWGRLPIVISAVCIPLISLVLYQQLGATTELTLRDQLQERSALMTSANPNAEDIARLTDDVIESMAFLARKLPDDPTYPVLLARLHADQGDYQQAIPYYLKSTVLLPNDGDILAEYAQVLFFAAGNQMSANVETLAMSALRLSPRNQTALSLAGIASFQGGEFRKAINYWEQALMMLPPGAMSGIALESGIAAAKERLGETDEPTKRVEGIALTLKVSLGEKVQVPGDTTVFVYARKWQGSPMPLAIARMQVADLPAEVVLTEAMAMTPAMSLATVDQVEVVARVSLAGKPTRAPGDFEASAGPIEVKTLENPVTLSINSQIGK